MKKTIKTIATAIVAALMAVVTSVSAFAELDMDRINEYASIYWGYANPDFAYHSGKNCANYVSQLINYAHVDTDNIWYPESYAWVNVYGLRDYFVNTHGIEYIAYPSLSQVEPGDVIYTSSTHVMMCQEAANGRYYCLATGNTNDRLNFPIYSWSLYGVLKTSRLVTLELGDVNGDGRISLTDVSQLTAYANGTSSSLAHPEVADVNEDGRINIVDSDILTRYYMGLIPSLPNDGGMNVEIKSVLYGNNTVDVYYGLSNDETPVTLAGYHGGYNQVWRLIPTDGTYYIIEAEYCDKVLDLHGRTDYAQICTRHGGVNQCFRLDKNSDGTYSIISEHGLMLSCDARTGEIKGIPASYFRGRSEKFTINYL